MTVTIAPAGVADADDLHRVYAAAFCAPPHNEPPETAVRWRDESLPQHAARSGFRLIAARDGGHIVGFAYGYTGEPGQWWTDHVTAAVPPEVAVEWLGGHFELVELAVLPSHARRGIGSALHDALLDGLTQRVALLTATADPGDPARRLYRRRGWQLVADDVFPDAVVLGKHLPRD